MKKHRQVDGLSKVRKPAKPKVTATYTRSSDYWVVKPYEQACLIEAFYKDPNNKGKPAFISCPCPKCSPVFLCGSGAFISYE